MKKWVAVFVILIVIIMVAVACHRGGGDGAGPTSGNEPIIPGSGPGPQPGVPDVVFSTPVQAAASTGVLHGTQALARAQFAVASAIGVGAQPAGFAPSLSGSGDIGSIDPAVAKIIQTMESFANSATIQRAVKKTAALRSAAMRATIPPPGITLTTEACNTEGKVVIIGENTYDEPDNPNVNSKYDITFTNCKDSGDLTQTDGTLHIEQFASINNDGIASTVNASSLTQITFADATFAVQTLTSVMTGTFISDNQVTKITNFADGSFAVTTPATAAAPQKVATFEYQGLEEIQTLTHNPDLTNTTVTTTKGTFKVTSASVGTTNLQMSLAMNLTENEISLNDAAGTRNNRLNGSVDMIYADNPATTGCLSGKLNITTVDTAPRVFTTAGGSCPTNGTVNINTATINYEPNAPIQVAVSGGTPVSFANCAAFDAAGGACKF